MIRRRIAVLVAGLLLALAFAPPAAAKGVNGNEIFCGGAAGAGSPPWIAFYGNDNYGPGPASNGLFVCDGPDIPNFNAVLQDSNDTCAGFGGVDFGRFENCISSFRFSDTGSTLDICLYTGTNYSGSKHKVVADHADLGGTLGGFDDAISSMKWVAQGAAC